VKISHGNLAHNERELARLWEHDERSVVASWLPLYHDMGLVGCVLQAVYAGARCVLLSPEQFAQRPSALAASDLAPSRDDERRSELRLRALRREDHGGGEGEPRSLVVGGRLQRRGAHPPRDAGALPGGVRGAGFRPEA
jgi:hypothetical protein